MPELTLSQAAKTVGRSKSQISRMVHSGKLSGSRQESGVILIDPAELARVYPSVPRETAPVQTAGNEMEPSRYAAELALVAELRKRLDDLIEERNRWRDMAERLSLAPPKPDPVTAPKERSNTPILLTVLLCTAVAIAAVLFKFGYLG
jgi:hypothetical protein